MLQLNIRWMHSECTWQYGISLGMHQECIAEYTRNIPSERHILSMGAMELCPTPQGSCRPPFFCSFFTLLVRGSSSEESEAASFSRMSAGLTPELNPPFANLRGLHNSFNESDRSTLPKMSFTATTWEQMPYMWKPLHEQQRHAELKIEPATHSWLVRDKVYLEVYCVHISKVYLTYIPSCPGNMVYLEVYLW